MKLTPEHVTELLIDVLKGKRTPFLWGSPSTAKSSVVKQVADKFNLKLIDIRLSQVDPLDLNGMVSVNEDRTRGEYLPMGVFPLEDDPIPEGYKGWLIFLDEANTAPLTVQAAAYRLILDKEVGQHPLHKHAYMCAAGNMESDKAITYKMSSALKSRLIHFEVDIPHKEWIQWANENDIDHRIVSFLNYKSTLLNNFDPDAAGFTYACGRTWEFLSDIIKPMLEINQRKLPLLMGTIGEGAAREFYTYTKIFKNLVSIEDIKRNPETVNLPNEPSIQYALTGLVANHMTTANADTLMLFVERLPVEYKILCLQQCVPRNRDLFKVQAVKDFLKRYGKDLEI